jgi:diguanylate cyclase (GGDEF)-like protein
MSLDLPTLMVMQSFGMACAGAVLISAWVQNRAVLALAIWGLADFLATAGLISLMLGVTSQQPAWSVVGGALLCAQSGLIWKAARNIDGKRAALLLALIGAAAIATSALVPGLHHITATLSVSGGAIYTIAAGISLWLGRSDRLIARWPLIGLAAVHAIALSIGTYSTLSGSTGEDTVPAITSLFGFIYFESLMFALGSAVFAFAMIKERNEASSMDAAHTDGLTGIANRGALLANAERAWLRCRRAVAPVSVVMFDLDRFKSVNDRFGHAVGDAVLKKFCEVMAAALRPHDLFARMGGEEFVVVMPGCGIEAAWIRAERIRASFAEGCRFIRNHQVNATVSGGVSVSLRSEQTLEELLEYSDSALYAAKADGRNRIKRADQSKPEGGLSTVIRVA